MWHTKFDTSYTYCPQARMGLQAASMETAVEAVVVALVVEAGTLATERMLSYSRDMCITMRTRAQTKSVSLNCTKIASFSLSKTRNSSLHLSRSVIINSRRIRTTNSYCSNMLRTCTGSEFRSSQPAPHLRYSMLSS